MTISRPTHQATLRLHERHFLRLMKPSFPVQQLTGNDLQTYINARAKETTQYFAAGEFQHPENPAAAAYRPAPSKRKSPRSEQFGAGPKRFLYWSEHIPAEASGFPRATKSHHSKPSKKYDIKFAI